MEKVLQAAVEVVLIAVDAIRKDKFNIFFNNHFINLRWLFFL